jgi:phosphoribosylformylglycinamidine synthase
MSGVVHGVGGYGNCFGVPNLGGETRFEDCYSGNPLVNAFALGLVRTDEIFYAKAEGVGNPVFYVGAKTGRDGIHGATMASEEFTEGSEQKRPNVQMGDPFLEKLLLEACLEVMKTGAVLGIQDMGAAGLTCSTCEMGARGGLGVTIELDKVPQRETGMTSYEIMLSESQERMLLVAAKGREAEVLEVFAKWGLDCAEVGIVTADDVMRVYHHGILEAEIPNKALTDDAPVYHRPVGVWDPPVPREPPAAIFTHLNQPRDLTADLKTLLASANICSKAWIFEQYDSMVQTNTVQGPGGEAGVMRIKGSGPREQGSANNGPHPIAESTPAGDAAMSGSANKGSVIPDPWAVIPAKPQRGLAMALAGNGRWCYLDPRLGAAHAVAEAARKVACTGATPVAATNCLNFGNPQKPEIMAQLSAAIDGIAEACTALGTPVTGGNVSLYNETLGEGIYPTPVLGIVGILDDVSKAVPAGFQAAGDRIFFLSAYQGKGRKAYQDFGATAHAQSLGLPLWGSPPVLDLEEEAALHQALAALADARLLRSCCDISDGGFAVAAAKGCFANSLGLEVGMTLHTDHPESLPFRIRERLFSEIPSSVVVSIAPESLAAAQALLAEYPKLYIFPLGTVGGANYTIRINGEAVIDTPLADLHHVWSTGLESQLAEELS